MRILAKYIYKYHIHNNTWKCSGKYFMLMGKGAGADVPVVNRIMCLGCIYEMISMLIPACWQVCYADVEMCQCEKWKSRTTTCSFIHDLCAHVGMSVSMLCRSGDVPVEKMENLQNYLPLHTLFMCQCRHVGNYEMPTWRCAGGTNIYEDMEPKICRLRDIFYASGSMLATISCHHGDALV